ncbi:MAG: polymerase subunit delta [Candidatus Saccharibacteria bacterium]|nr:polymerase subunit delta [Candidatus Saccharibacteria bacterium]
MISTLTGANNWTLQAKLQEYVSVYLKEYGDMGLERLDGEEASMERIREAVTTLPFLEAKKLVIVRNPSALKEFSEKFADLLKEIPDTTDVIIVETKLDKRSSYYKTLKKDTQYQEFTELDGNGLAAWLASTAKEQGGSLSSTDARLLVERVGVNQQMLSKELEKLLAYDSKITKATIELLTEKSPQSTIFELIDAAMSGNTKRALQLYDEQRQQKVEPQQVIAMLAWQLHVLAIVKAAGGKNPNDIASEAKLNPYVVRKVEGLARRMTMNDIKRLIGELLDIDVSLKTRSIDADEVLQNYLILSLGAK